MSTDAAKAVVRRNNEEVQNKGNFDKAGELLGAGGLGPLADAQNLHCHVSKVKGLSLTFFHAFQTKVAWGSGGGLPILDRRIYCTAYDSLPIGYRCLSTHRLLRSGHSARARPSIWQN